QAMSESDLTVHANTNRDGAKPRSRRNGLPPGNGLSQPDATPIVPPDPRELKRRFGNKGGEIERCVERFPRHEAIARAAYHRLTGDRDIEVPPGEHAVADLVGVAAL